MTLEEIKSRINPAYADCLGTESYERKWLCDRIDELEKQRDELIRERDRIYVEGSTPLDWPEYYSSRVAIAPVKESK
jgi:hypothetical protein